MTSEKYEIHKEQVPCSVEDRQGLQALKEIEKEKHILKVAGEDEHLTPLYTDLKGLKLEMMQCFGTDNEDFVTQMMTQLGNIVPSVGAQTVASHLNSLMPILADIHPRNSLEGAIAVKIVAIHVTALEMMRKAMLPDQFFDATGVYLNRANRLIKTFTELLDALHKIRGRNHHQQGMIGHMTMESGSQAIIAETIKQGGDDEK